MKKTLSELLLLVATMGLSLVSAANVRIICDYPITLKNVRASDSSLLGDITLEKDTWYSDAYGITQYWNISYGERECPELDETQTLTAELDGYRCTGWYTLSESDEGSWGSKTDPSKCNTSSPLVAGQKGQPAVSINLGEKLQYAKTSKYTYFYSPAETPAKVICPLFVKVWTIQTAVSPAGAGTATGDGVYDEGEQVQLSATAKDGYQFACWQVGETTVSTEAKYSPTVTADVTYTAVFQPKTYTVSFNKAQGTGGKDSISAIYQEAMPSLDAADLPQRFGWSFAGYFASPNGSGTKYYNADGTSAHNWDKPNGATLYAAWTPNQYDFNIVFPAAGSVSRVCYRIGQSEGWIEVSSTTTVKVNCGETCFAYDLAAAGYQAQYTKEQCWSGTMTGNGLTFTPQPTLLGYQLTVNPNGGLFMGSTESYTFADQRLVAGEKTLSAIDVPTPVDGVFLGFFAGNEPVYDRQGHNVKGTYWTDAYPDGVFQGTKDLTVVARWGKAYQIHTDVEPTESGTVEGGGYYEENASVTLTATSANGYSFSCWTNEMGFVTNANPWTFKATAAVTYTAVFTGNVYKVTFRTEGGQPENPVRYVTFGSTYGEFPVVTKSGYLLDGWYTDYDGAGVKILPESPVSIAKNHNLIANWKEKTTATVIWADQSKTTGNVWVTNEVVKGATISEAPAVTKSWQRAGYWPKGWNPSLPHVVTGDTTFNLAWESLSDVLDCDDLTFSIEPGSEWKIVENDSHAGDSSLRIDELNPNVSDVVSTSVTKSGRLSFWWKCDEGTTLYVSYGDTNELCPGTNGMGWVQTTIEIKNVSNPVSIQFSFISSKFGDYCALDNVSWKTGLEYELSVAVDPSAPYGTVTKDPDRDSYADGSPVTITAKANDGYAFEKWNDDVTDSNRTVTVTANVSYTASFTACVYRVALDANGGTGGTNEVRATYNQLLPKLELLPQREHYAFAGYFDAEAGGTQYYNADGSGAAYWEMTSNATLFARWTEDGKYNVTVSTSDATRGSVTKEPSSPSYYAGDEVELSAMANDGYSFEKWSDGVTAANRTITVESNATYVASFTACVYRVTLNANGGTGGASAVWAAYGEILPDLDLSSLPSKGSDKFCGYFDAAADGSQCYDANGKGLVVWNKTSAAELFAHWTKDVGDVSRALDCDNLVFEKSGGFSVTSSYQFGKKTIEPYKGESFLVVEGCNDENLTATIDGPGTLTFFCHGVNSTLQVFIGQSQIGRVDFGEGVTGWSLTEVKISESADQSLKFIVVGNDDFLAIDGVTWTPDAGEKTPTPGEAVAVTAASVKNGTFALTIPAENGVEYGVWTNRDLHADGWGLMGEPKKAAEASLEFEWQILPEFPQLFFKAHKVDYQ